MRRSRPINLEKGLAGQLNMRTVNHELMEAWRAYCLRRSYELSAAAVFLMKECVAQNRIVDYKNAPEPGVAVFTIRGFDNEERLIFNAWCARRDYRPFIVMQWLMQDAVKRDRKLAIPGCTPEV